MHCEHAPCEPVCPVAASVHDSEGLNVQVYNRCVGTRFCEANCPYKVRRFNFFGYADGQEYKNFGAEIVNAQNNPDVTVRARGVMEKCTYCIQRISRARRTAEKENRAIRDGEVVTACQAACPTRAISFGDLSRSGRAVNALRRGHAALRAARPFGHAAAHDLSRAAAQSQPGLQEGAGMSALAIDVTTSPAPLRWTLPQARSFDAVNDSSRAPLLSAGLWSRRAWWIGFAVSLALDRRILDSPSSGLLARRRHLGHQHQRRLGLRHRQLRLVDRHRQRRHADLVDAAADAAAMARLDQPLRGGDDALRGVDRRPLPDHSSRAAHVFLLAHALPEHDDVLAAMAQRADLGFLGDPELPPVLDHLLVYRHDPRSRDAAGPGASEIAARVLRRAGARLARLGAALACLRDLSHHDGRLGVPLVVSLHSIVGLDFAASLMPGWQETIFPPYFVVGAMFSGFAMVVCLAALVRWGFRMQALITFAHFDVMAKIMLAAAAHHGASYATEWFSAWYGGEHADRSLIVFVFTGAYAPMFWAMLALQRGHAASVLVRRRAARNVFAVFAIAIFINIGMWLERILILWNTLSHDYAAEHVAPLHADILGLDHHDRLARPVRTNVSDFLSIAPGGVDA